ncbi:uncharacterized protein I303_102499 [Kwoniella dejecticola CBS 10117]|uniref:G-patch domain-containing protein n=1 Tax=Kwoniella dejecticola CBS 10117 TaxID=1296121 RepID=A0A1A6A8X2_9TREE|nr:uncharacterized protein I303_02513 [Kwoniella dejecticola CBS 10117]OBR86505.1 hypothetical protein I303_02513 [Kwoniella dejecticola CBS 10117]
MSYRPRSRSRSPEYRARRYSPSRPLSPMRSDIPPPRRYDDDRGLPHPYPPRRSPPPPTRRYDSPPRRSGGYDDYPPPPRRYDDEYPPPSRRYDDDRPRYDERERVRYDEERYIPPPRHPRGYDERDRDWDRYDDRRESAGMAADREEIRPRREYQGGRSEPQWERGRDVEELAAGDEYGASDYPSGPKRGGGSKGPSEPARDIIFLGLDPELTEQDFSGYLRSEHKAVLESVKIVRDRITGQSKCFGFAQFKDLDGAEEFIHINYPAVLMPALYSHSSPRKVKIDFSATQASSGAHGNDGQAHQHQPQYVRPAHDGMKDIGTFGGGKRVLLLRGLDASTTADDLISRMSQEIARMMGRVGKEIAAESTIVRVILIVDRNVRSSWGYAFIELATTELAAALLPFLLAPQHQPNGLIINYVPVAPSFANPEAFVPIPAGPLGGEFILRPSRNGGIASETLDKPEGQWCAYWHQAGGAVETISRGAPIIGEDGLIQLTPEHRSFLGTLAGVPAQVPPPQSIETAQASMTPINLTGGVQPIKIGGPGKGKKRDEMAGMVPIIGKNMLDEEEDQDLVGKDSVLLSRSKGVYIIPPKSSSRKIAKNINKWNTKQSELAAPEPISVDTNAPPKGISDVNSTLGVKRSFGETSIQSAASGPSKSPQTDSTSTENFDYTDTSNLATTGKVACLLCQRQFKTEEVLKKHVAQSDLHKTNLADSNAREAGMKRKNAIASSNSVPAPEDDPSVPKYRDRAAERREAFNQPSIPLPEESPSWQAEQAKKRKFAEGPKAPSPAPPPPPPGAEPGKDESNVGNQLLAKMGWVSGTGLGKGKEGRVDPILVQQFENRAGLGASKGVEAGKYSGPGGFQQRAKDMAKERYANSPSGST